MILLSIARRLGLALVVVALPLVATAAEERRLHVYNWSDYIAPDTIANFTKETGIEVTYDVYDGNEVLEAKLLAGHSGYDIVVPSASPFMARQIAAGAYLVLDKAKLPNLKNLDPQMLALAASADPGNAHGVPYLWSVTGIGYNVAMLRRAREAERGVELAFRVPREGAQMSIDMLGIPKDAPHPDNAHRFIDYILRPEVVAAITNAVSYPNPNLAARPFVATDIRDDPGIYP